MKLLETDPKILASLIADDDIGERIWQPGELATILRHQMATPLKVDLSGLRDGAGRPMGEAGADELLLKSFGDLLQHPRPPLALLLLMKDFAKASRMSPANTLPHEVASVIYFASIIAAMVRRSRRITKLADADLAKALDWALAQPWLEEISRAVFQEGRAFLSGRGPVADPVREVSAERGE